MKTSNETELVHLEARVRSEYIEMPGLSLAPAQAARLWALDRSLTDRLLDRLVAAGFLRRTREGLYLRPSEGRPW